MSLLKSLLYFPDKGFRNISELGYFGYGKIGVKKEIGDDFGSFSFFTFFDTFGKAFSLPYSIENVFFVRKIFCCAIHNGQIFRSKVTQFSQDTQLLEVLAAGKVSF